MQYRPCHLRYPENGSLKKLKLTFLQLKAVRRNSVYQYYLHMLLTLLPSFFSPTASWTFFCSAGSVSVDEEEKEKEKNKQSNRQRTFFITQRCTVHSWGTFSHTYSCMHIRTFPEILPSLFCYSRSSLAINMACIKIRTVNTTLTCDSSDCVLALHFLARIM